MATATEMREMTVQELHDREKELRRERFDLRMKMINDGSVMRRYQEVRKELARVLTIRVEKERAGGASA